MKIKTYLKSLLLLSNTSKLSCIPGLLINCFQIILKYYTTQQKSSRTHDLNIRTKRTSTGVREFAPNLWKRDVGQPGCKHPSKHHQELVSFTAG